MAGMVNIAVTLANSIIGVSILTMPYCLKQCGVVLGSIMMLIGALLTRFTCHLLLKSGHITRRKSYELVAFSTFGPIGKLVVELCIIGFMIGILISFFVVMGDLGTPIVSKALSIQNTGRLRTLSLLAFGLGVALPLSMLKKVESLIGLSTASVVFYILLACKALCEALPVLVSKTCWDAMYLWRPSGILQSLPIFAMALSCQTQIFQVYECLPDQSLKKMNSVIKVAVYMCTFLYLSVGVFGYSAFCDKEFGGNILTSFSPGIFTEIIKCCFLVSVAFSFPLVVLPCRSSIHSLVFKKHSTPIDVGMNVIPETRFKAITFSLIIVTLGVGIICPNIEMVLGFVGSTIGVVICIIMPAMIFINLTHKSTFEKWGAQFVLAVGFFLLVSGTWVNLMEMAGGKINKPQDVIVNEITAMPDIDNRLLQAETNLNNVKVGFNEISPTIGPQPTGKGPPPDKELKESENSVRKEPPNPQEPDEVLRRSDAPEVIGNQDGNLPTKNPVDNVEEKAIPAHAEAPVPVDDGDKKEDDIAQRQEEVLKKLEKQHEEQIQILERQKEILEELKEHGRHHEPKTGEGNQDGDKQNDVQVHKGNLRQTNSEDINNGKMTASKNDKADKMAVPVVTPGLKSNNTPKVSEKSDEKQVADGTKLIEILDGSVMKGVAQQGAKTAEEQHASSAEAVRGVAKDDVHVKDIPVVVAEQDKPDNNNVLDKEKQADDVQNADPQRQKVYAQTFPAINNSLKDLKKDEQ